MADPVTVPDHVVPEFNNKLPLILNVAVPLVIVQPVTLTVRSKQFKIPTQVILPGDPLPESKKTLSAEVGTDAPLEPPDEADQLVVELVSQVPAPPTQYLLAIYFPKFNINYVVIYWYWCLYDIF